MTYSSFTLCRIARRSVKCQPFLMCPGRSFQGPLLGTIYCTSLDNYIQWVNAKVFLSNRKLLQHAWIKQYLILTYSKAIQEGQKFLKVADILRQSVNEELVVDCRCTSSCHEFKMYLPATKELSK